MLRSSSRNATNSKADIRNPLILLIQLCIFLAEIRQQWLCRELFVAYFAEYVFWQAQPAVAVNLLIQPVGDLQDPSGCEQLIDASEVALDSLKRNMPS